MVAEYRYNGLGFRISEHYDVDTDGDVDGSDNVYYFVYTPNWQLAATFRDSDSDPKETFLWHQSASSYIDSIIHVNRDVSNGWTDAADGTLEVRYHPLQSWRADVVCLINADGSEVLERVTYDPYGVPTAWNPADSNLDGALTGVDYSNWVTRSNNSDVLADMNLDGVFDSADLTIWTSHYNTGDSGGREVLSLAINQNRIGYAGYVHDTAIQVLTHTRHRVLDTKCGIWVRRDITNYLKEMNLYQYSGSNPINRLDYYGADWSNIDFWVHYRDGSGGTIFLSNVGLADDYESHPAIINHIETVLLSVQQAAREAAWAAEAKLDCTCDGNFGPEYDILRMRGSRSVTRDEFVLGYGNALQNIIWTYMSGGDINDALDNFYYRDWTYSIGGHILNWSAACMANASCYETCEECAPPNWAFGCVVNFFFIDNFSDPLSMNHSPNLRLLRGILVANGYGDLVEPGTPYDITHSFNRYISERSCECPSGRERGYDKLVPGGHGGDNNDTDPCIKDQ